MLGFPLCLKHAFDWVLRKSDSETKHAGHVVWNLGSEKPMSY